MYRLAMTLGVLLLCSAPRPQAHVLSPALYAPAALAASSPGVAPPAAARSAPVAGEGSWFAFGDVAQSVNALAVGPDGAVYAAGQFTQISGVSANPVGYLVARWDGAAWTALGGANDWIFALHIAADGTVFAGGRFTQIGGVEAQRFAAYDPVEATWRAVGAGFNNPVHAIEQGPDGCLYAGGSFRIHGDNSGLGVARSCDGATWAYVGGGTSDAVYDLGFRGDTLFAVGSFMTAGGVPAAKVAQFDLLTGAWSAVGGGITQQGGGPTVYALGVAPDGDVYVGGAFTEAGGVSTSGLARWDGTAWHDVGGGFTGANRASASVRDLLVDAGGQVYIGGAFDAVGGVSAGGVARWTGAAWESLGEGVGNGTVLTLALGDRRLYAGGGFSNMDGIEELDYLAQWEGGVQTPAEPGPGGAADALALDAPTPNPSSGWATLRFTVPRAQPVRLELFDVLGRRVAVLYEGAAAPGAPVAVTVEGRALPAGAYVARLAGEGGRATRILTIAR